MKMWSHMILRLFSSVKLAPALISFRTQSQRFEVTPTPKVLPHVLRSQQYEMCSTKSKINFSALIYFSFSIIYAVIFSLVTLKLFLTSRSPRFFTSSSSHSSVRCCHNKTSLQSSSMRYKFMWKRWNKINLACEIVPFPLDIRTQASQ